MDFYAITDVGNKRMNNEDYYGYLMGKQGNPHYFIVADGMGGHNSGEVASKLAVEYILKNVKEHNYPFADEYEAKTFIKDMLEQANSLIYRNSVAERVNEGMGTTAVMAVINGKKLIVGNVGDSRAYIVRKNGIKQLTNDHSYIEELIRAGEITREQSENHPDRHIITRALGGESHIAVDIFSQDMERGDLLILCSDGLSSVSSVDEIYNTVKVFTSCKDLAFALVEMAKNNGSSDNITIMAVRI
ncbi:MAG: Stp1/IreP family PP2C-type Ser/Thr phosphatase [Clostridiales bacterium]|nr:Stp1/IreP family PP2C-type Ser/Thr phosphatase [Clostridiales bacterium]